MNIRRILADKARQVIAVAGRCALANMGRAHITATSTKVNRLRGPIA